MAVEATLPGSSTSGDDLEAPSKSQELAELMGTPPTRVQNRSRITAPGACDAVSAALCSALACKCCVLGCSTKAAKRS